MKQASKLIYLVIAFTLFVVTPVLSYEQKEFKLPSSMYVDTSDLGGADVEEIFDHCCGNFDQDLYIKFWATQDGVYANIFVRYYHRTFLYDVCDGHKEPYFQEASKVIFSKKDGKFEIAIPSNVNINSSFYSYLKPVAKLVGQLEVSGSSYFIFDRYTAEVELLGENEDVIAKLRMLSWPISDVIKVSY